MKEHPILFSGPMVRAILDGKKTRTRRIVKPPPDGFEWVHKKPGDIHWWEDWNPECEQWERHELAIKSHCLCYAGHIERCANPRRDLKSYPVPWESSPFDCPYGRVGDSLWVREKWATVKSFDDTNPAACWKNERPPALWYTADTGAYLSSEWRGRWRPSIHMPRWASRITLEVTGVRVERLQDISEEDAEAEGVERLHNGPRCYPGTGAARTRESARDAFKRLWDEINPKHPWESNPWVWVVSFKRLCEVPV